MIKIVRLVHDLLHLVGDDDLDQIQSPICRQSCEDLSEDDWPFSGVIDAAVVDLEGYVADQAELGGADGRERFGNVEVGLKGVVGYDKGASAEEDGKSFFGDLLVDQQERKRSSIFGHGGGRALAVVDWRAGVEVNGVRAVKDKEIDAVAEGSCQRRCALECCGILVELTEARRAA